MKDKSVLLKDFIEGSSRKVKLENLNAKQGFTFEDERMLQIRKKIEASGVAIGKKGDLKVARGLYTGCNAGFIIGKNTYSKIIMEEPKSKIHVYRYIRGKNIDAYSIRRGEQDEYVINVNKGWTNLNRGDTGAEQYFKTEHPELYSHIKSIGDKIVSKEIKVKGIGVYGRGNMGDYWWELQNFNYNGKEEKVLIPDIQEGSASVYDNEIIWDSTIYAILGKTSKELTCIVNSKIFRSINDKLYSTSKLGEALRWKKEAIDKIYVPQNIEEVGLSGYTDQIQSLKKQGKCTLKLEQEVEKIVQELYGLTDEEVEYLCK